MTSVGAARARRRQDESWRPQSWRQSPAAQQPGWPDEAAAHAVLGRLRELPGLVSGSECAELISALAGVAGGRGFLLQGGDCAETFDALSSIGLHSRCRLLSSMARTVTASSGLSTVIVGRIAGQYAKPRSAATEDIGQTSLPSYRGDMINSLAADPSARQPDPFRMLTAYFHSAAAMNALRLRAADEPRVYISHEALVLGYEEALVRLVQDPWHWFGASAHLLWIGDRTRDPGGAHVRFLSGLANPVGVKIGPTCAPGDVVALCEALNPGRVAGRVTLITRLGASAVATALPPIIRAVTDAGHPVVWVCDPMHGNTRRTVSGYKTRDVAAIIAEIRGFFAVHREQGTHPGGIHLELAGEHVTECVGGGVNPVAEDRVPHAYQSACDPRLSPAQALECAAVVAAELNR
jgi:3-deoxy-7-phosphoheptulonate synthase